jgi:hypothetical protein
MNTIIRGSIRSIVFKDNHERRQYFDCMLRDSYWKFYVSGVIQYVIWLRFNLECFSMILLNWFNVILKTLVLKNISQISLN